jgi:uncharacterized membrane protein
LARGDAVSMVVLPHRSLSRAGLWLFLTAQGIAAGGFALLAAWRGNVFAPLFAILELGVVAWCLTGVWRMCATSGQIIVLRPDRLEIARVGEDGPVVQFHPYWVRLSLQSGAWRNAPSRLLVRSHGREVEIGAFLNDEERADLAARLTELLAQVRDPGRMPRVQTDQTNSDAG